MMNSADEAQVKDAGKKEKQGRDRELDDLKYLLSLVQFRRYAWRLMSHCKTYETVFDVHNGRMAMLAGRQDVGHFIMAEINDADSKMFAKMMEEAKK